jgi:hypothetical protein
MIDAAFSTQDFLCQILRGEPATWPAIPRAGATDVFESAAREGVHLLVALRLRQEGAVAACPPSVRARFESALRDEWATEQIVRRELRDVLAALNAEGVGALLFKGAALAFTHYPDPAARPRVDTDVLVRLRDVRAAARVFDRLGYRRELCVTGELVGSDVPDQTIDRYLASSQIPYSKIDRYDIHHEIDLHWKPSIPHVFANLLSADDLTTSAVPVPALGDGVKAFGPVHALALACMHRVAHHHSHDRLIWLYDIHLLSGALTREEAGSFVQLAVRSGISAVCLQGLSVSREKFLTVVPGELMNELRLAQTRHVREPSAVYVGTRLRKVDVLLSDLAVLSSWSQRARLLRQHVFAPASYMQKVYGVSGRAWLPVLYAWRFVTGALAWFSRQ